MALSDLVFFSKDINSLKSLINGLNPNGEKVAINYVTREKIERDEVRNYAEKKFHNGRQ